MLGQKAKKMPTGVGVLVFRNSRASFSFFFSRDTWQVSREKNEKKKFLLVFIPPGNALGAGRSWFKHPEWGLIFKMSCSQAVFSGTHPPPPPNGVITLQVTSFYKP